MQVNEIRNLCKGDVCYLVCASKIDGEILEVKKMNVISKGRKYITLEAEGIGIFGKRAHKTKFDLITNKLLCVSENYEYTLSTIKEIYDLDLDSWSLDCSTKEDLKNYMRHKIENNLITTMPLYKKVFGSLINFDELKIKVKQLDNNNILGSTELLTHRYKGGCEYTEVIGVEINITPTNMDITKLTKTMFHELGHVLHCQEFQNRDVFSENLPVDGNVWDYAKTNYLENFAVAVQDAYMCNQKTKKRNEFIYELIDSLKNK